MIDLSDKAVVVTGSGRGLGEAYAVAAAQAGARVVVNDIDGDQADRVKKRIIDQGGTAVADHHSVAEPDQAAALIDGCVERFGTIDGLVNNAGRFHTSQPWDEDVAQVQKLLAVNVFGVMYCGLAALRVMVPNRRGSIVNIVSGAHLGIRSMSTYGASKGAVASMTYGWSLDAADHGVRVNSLSPIADTRMTAMNAAPGRPPGPHPDKIAPLVVYLLSDAATFTGRMLRLTGQRLSVMVPPRDGERGRCRTGWDVDDVHADITALLTVG